jgi:hypothetical protein
MTRINLLQETTDKLIEHGLSPHDILWVGSDDGEFVIDWDSFAAISDSEYDNVSLPCIVAPDLVVVGADWWLERQECDGAEWWEFKRIPVINTRPREFNVLMGGKWSRLKELNGGCLEP